MYSGRRARWSAEQGLIQGEHFRTARQQRARVRRGPPRIATVAILRAWAYATPGARRGVATQKAGVARQRPHGPHWASHGHAVVRLGSTRLGPPQLRMAPRHCTAQRDTCTKYALALAPPHTAPRSRAGLHPPLWHGPKCRARGAGRI